MKERLEKLAKEIIDLDNLISAWEGGFVDSLVSQVDKGRTLSPKQLDVLHRIEAKVEKLTKGDPEWEVEWNEEKKWEFETAVAYYKASSAIYFRQILDWYAQHPSAIPPRNFYQKLVKNKYAQKVINSLKTDPKYPTGTTVMLRAQARTGLDYLTATKLRNIPLFVVQPTQRAVSAANGCRLYSLLSSVSSDIVEIEERWLKKWKKGKSSPVSDEILF